MRSGFVAKCCRCWVAIAALSAAAGCAPLPYLFLQYGKELRQGDIGKIVMENPLKPEENIKIINLGRGQGSSHHVVQIRDRESPHLHKSHDATVMVVEGNGYLLMDKQRITLGTGDIVHIPRGVPHYYVNTHFTPTVAFVIFAPPFDGKDNVPVGNVPAGF